MKEDKFDHEAKRKLTFEKPEPPVAFRIAWYVMASQPGVYLTDYGEAEAQDFEGHASFSAKYNESKVVLELEVQENASRIEMSIQGDNEVDINALGDELIQRLETSIEKYLSLTSEAESKARRALVAKTCWDRLVYYIFEKKPLSDVYYMLAHGREMMIKATEGEAVEPLTLSTSAWLSRFDSLSREEPTPTDLASGLAKKSIEWKKATHMVIEKYL
ncbi:hypothetical protein EU537_08000 [Candidatus Thorarchaeota archaeon]|nr:MAG: hypothetical protein EU537_08000 [Candidatus Thorarchaeota archaeon]